MADSELCDCLISGAGPTGLTLALELSRRGKTVRIFDRSSGPRPEDQSRALGILPSTLAALGPSGVAEQLIEEGLKIKEAQIFQGNKLRARVPLETAGGEHSFILSLPQGRTERLLIAALSTFGVEVEWNSQVVGIVGDTSNPGLEIEHENIRSIHEGRMVAGCDGLRSIVRQQLGISFEGDQLETVFSLADVELVEPFDENTMVARIDETGVLAQIPLPGGQVRLISSSPSIEKASRFRGRFKSIGWTSDFSIQFNHADRLSQDGFHLAGDAAHVHSPVGGRGMNTGIADAAWLAYLVCQGRDGEYEAHRLPVAKKVINQTRNMTKFLAKPSSLRSVLLNFLIGPLMKFKVVQKRAAQQLLAHDMPYPEWIERGRY